MPNLDLIGVQEARVATNGISLNVAQAGPPDGKPVILLHGFPEFSFGWREQIPALAGAGFRVWAPDQRGYNTSDKPYGQASYRIDTLARDVIGLIEAMGHERAAIVGHDWGGAVAWWLATYHAEHVERVAVLNCPHPLVFAPTLMRSPLQVARSWYTFFFQVPWLPEQLFAANDYAAGVAALRATSRSGTFTDEALARYRLAWSEPGAVTAMMNWYRANATRFARASLPDERIDVPLLFLWGLRDVALGRELIQPSLDLCTRAEPVLLDTAGHWLTLEEPETVNRHLIAFLGA